MIAVIKATAERNSRLLKDAYQSQSSFSRICRQKKVSCADAASALLAESEVDQLTKQDVIHALSRLVIAIADLTGKQPEKVHVSTAVADLSAMIANAEAVEADSATLLADLDRLAGCAETPGTRALAAHEAAFVRGKIEKQVFYTALDNAKEALHKCDKHVVGTTVVKEDICTRLKEAFKMGYVDALWRGIEHLLPEGVAESCGKMPRILEKVAKSS